MIFAQRKVKIQKSKFDHRSMVRIESVMKSTVANDFRTKKVKIHKSTFDHRSMVRSEPATKSTVHKKCGNKVAKENCGGPKWEIVVPHSAICNL